MLSFFISFSYIIFIRGDAGSYQVKVIIRFPSVIDVRQAIIGQRNASNCKLSVCKGHNQLVSQNMTVAMRSFKFHSQLIIALSSVQKMDSRERVLEKFHTSVREAFCALKSHVNIPKTLSDDQWRAVDKNL